MENTADIQLKALQMINQRMREKGFSHAELGRRLNLSTSTTQKMLNGKVMNLARLKELSIALDFNFFTALAGLLNLTEPETEEHQRIRELEMENRILTKLLKPNP